MADRTPKPDDLRVGRLALRQEGEFWNAYWAKNETMEGATLLGSIRMAIVEKCPAAKDLFMATMREALSEGIFQEFGIRPAWGGLEKAPEHERAGNG